MIYHSLSNSCYIEKLRDPYENFDNKAQGVKKLTQIIPYIEVSDNICLTITGMS